MKKPPIVHALKTPCPVNDLRTECGMKIHERLSKRHQISMAPAAATCVPCAAVVEVKQKLERLERGLPEKGVNKYVDWAMGPDSGMSSQTIVAALTDSIRLRHGPRVPLDPDDFGRCYRMLQLFPELRPRLMEVADRYPMWSKLATAWSELELLWLEESPTGTAPKLYARIQELQP